MQAWQFESVDSAFQRPSGEFVARRMSAVRLEIEGDVTLRRPRMVPVNRIIVEIPSVTDYSGGACVGLPVEQSEWFFSRSLIDQWDAKRICRSCPIERMCLEENLDAGEGIYGGLTKTERNDLIRHRRRAAGRRRD